MLENKDRRKATFLFLLLSFTIP